MGAKDSDGRAPGDAEFMRPVKNWRGDEVPAKLVLGTPGTLDGAVAAGLLGRLTEGGHDSRFSRWAIATGAAPSGADTGDAGDAGEGAVASVGDAVAAAARVVLVTALLARATSGEVPEKGAMLEQLEGAQLQEANLYGAQLQKAILYKAQLQKAYLRYAKLQGAELRYAQLQEADLRYAELQEANLPEAQLQKADLRNAQLQEADLEEAQLQKTNLSKANLVGVRAEGADLTGAQLQHATVGAEPDKDTKVTSFTKVCAPAPRIRSLRSYHFVTLMCDGAAGLPVRRSSPTRTARAPSSSPSISRAPH
jgi:hypothetical protein